MSKKKIFSTINAISFNHDGSMVALCAGTEEIFVYTTNGSDDPSKWEKKYKLKEHTQKATVIDWNPVTNLILSGSYDRSIFVWKYNEEHDKFLPMMVNMDEKLSILDLKWNKQGTKFVVGTSSKRLYLGYYNEKNNWWSTAEIK